MTDHKCKKSSVLTFFFILAHHHIWNSHTCQSRISSNTEHTHTHACMYAYSTVYCKTLDPQAWFHLSQVLPVESNIEQPAAPSSKKCVQDVMSLSQLIYLFSRISSVLYCERNPETAACVTKKHWGVMYSKSRVSCQSAQKSWDYSPSIFSAFMIVNVGFISTAAVMIIRSAWINNAASLFNSNTSKSAIYFKGKKKSSPPPLASRSVLDFVKKYIFIYIYNILLSH